VANIQGGERRHHVHCLAWTSGRDGVVSVRLPAAVGGDADAVLEVGDEQVRLRTSGLYPTPVRAWLLVDPVGWPGGDASIPVEVLSVDGPRRVQLGWAGFPYPHGLGRTDRSPVDPPPWPAPTDPDLVLVDETDGSAWAWDGRRWRFEDPPLTHPIPTTEVELRARALFAERVGPPRDPPSFVCRLDHRAIIVPRPHVSEIETLERPDREPADGTSRPPELRYGHQVAYGLWSDASGWWWQDGRWEQVDPPGTWQERRRLAAEIDRVVGALERAVEEVDDAGVSLLQESVAAVADQWRVLGYLLASYRGNDYMEHRRRLLTAALTGGPIPPPDPEVATRLAANRRLSELPSEQLWAELVAAEPLLEILAAEVVAAGKLPEISTRQRLERLRSRHPDLHKRIQGLVGPGSDWLRRSGLPATAAGGAESAVLSHLLDQTSTRPRAPASMSEPLPLELDLVAELAGPLAGREPVAASVGPAGEAVLLAVQPDDVDWVFVRVEGVDWASFPESRTRPYDATVLVLGDGGRLLQRVELQGLDLTHPLVQPLPDGEILVVGARCERFRDGRVEANSQVHGPDGQLRRAFTLGDGINDLQATGAGELWVGYSDEGLLGNETWGWGVPGGPAGPIGAAGLVRFDAHGRRQWEYQAPEGAPGIDDCMALNVTDEAVWVCYHADFPLVRIPAAGPPRAWPTWLTGIRALAVGGSQVLLYGGYQDQANRCLLFRLGDRTLDDPRPCRLSLPDGTPPPVRGLVGRGPFLHAFTATGWYQLDVRQCA
jgi:hypothetical protein